MRTVLSRWTRYIAAFGAVVLPAVLPAQAAETTSLPMYFSVIASPPDCNGCVIINATGRIGDETARDFADFISRNRKNGILPKNEESGQLQPIQPRKVIVAFDSMGGKIQPALIMGRRIRKSGWITVAGRASLEKGRAVFSGADCFSACTMVLLGGENRFVIPGSRIGVHQFSPQFNEGETFDARQMNQIVRDYGREVVNVYDFAKAMGVSENFFMTTLRTPFSSVDVLPEEEWVSTGVATALLPSRPAQSMPVETVLEQTTHDGETATIQQPAPTAPLPPPSPAVSNGLWTVSHKENGPVAIEFSSPEFRVSLACRDRDQVRVDLSFRNLAPHDLEKMRAAAFSAGLLNIGGIRVPIDTIALPGSGEQQLDATINANTFKIVTSNAGLAFEVLDKSGEAAGRSPPIPTQDVVKVITSVTHACGR